MSENLRKNTLVALISLVFLGSALLGARAAQGEDPEDQYVRIFSVIDQADALNAKGQTNSAAAKYRQAYTDLLKFQKANPRWNAQVVSFRLEYLAAKVAESAAGRATNATSVVGAETGPGAQGKPESQASGVEVKLLQAGAEPRKALRLHPKAGEKQSMAMTLQIGVEVKMGQMQNPPMKFPPMTMAMEVTVQDVAPDGDITYEAVMGDTAVAEDPGANPQIIQGLRSALGGIKGMSLSGKVSSRGLSKGFELKAQGGQDAQAAQIMDQMKDSFGNMSVDLPEEPVGIGGKWEVRMPIKSQGMTINQTAVYELVSIEGEQIKAKSTLTQAAANQKIRNPAMPGMDMNLVKMNGAGTADMVYDLTRLWPAQASIKMRTDSSLGVNAGGQKQTMSTRTDLSVSLQSK